MRLNIYLISHPIIKQLSQDIINSNLINEQIYKHNTKLLGYLLIYETIRRWVNIHYIYIKNIESYKEIYKFDTQESYIILTDLIECNDIISNISTILPKMGLQHINFKNNQQDNYEYIQTIGKEKIIIVEKFLNNYSVIRLIDYLVKKQKIKSSQIKIMCVTCSHSICEYLGNQYQSLEIYTTKIYKYQ